MKLIKKLSIKKKRAFQNQLPYQHLTFKGISKRLQGKIRCLCKLQMSPSFWVNFQKLPNHHCFSLSRLEAFFMLHSQGLLDIEDGTIVQVKNLWCELPFLSIQLYAVFSFLALITIYFYLLVLGGMVYRFQRHIE